MREGGFHGAARGRPGLPAAGPGSAEGGALGLDKRDRREGDSEASRANAMTHLLTKLLTK